jgi:hypothetical protein
VTKSVDYGRSGFTGSERPVTLFVELLAAELLLAGRTLDNSTSFVNRVACPAGTTSSRGEGEEDALVLISSMLET